MDGSAPGVVTEGCRPPSFPHLDPVAPPHGNVGLGNEAWPPQRSHRFVLPCSLGQVIETGVPEDDPLFQGVLPLVKCMVIL